MSQPADPTPAAGAAPLAPSRFKLKRDTALTIDWSDGTQSVLPIAALRRGCPCATCKEQRAKAGTTRLMILPESAASDAPLTVAGAELVGNYALRLTWSDGHDKGIYSFVYLRELATG